MEAGEKHSDLAYVLILAPRICQWLDETCEKNLKKRIKDRYFGLIQLVNRLP